MAKRRTIRWDRVLAAAIVLVVLIFIAGFLSQRCSGDERPPVVSGESSSSAAGTSAPPADTTVTASSQLTPNVPVVITDEPGTGITSATSATETQPNTETEPVATLPAGYVESGRLARQQIHEGDLILVNSGHPCELSKEQLDLEQVYFASDKPDNYEISYPGHTALNRTALSQFNRLMKAYYGATNNSEIMFNYGWLEDGKEKSNPESSTALDIQLHIKRKDGGYEYISNITPYSWLFEHMASYGFIQRYPLDKAELTGDRSGWTAIRYVGVPHAAYMRENNLCLEEYIDLLRTEYSYDKQMLSYSTPELSYQIYYAPFKPNIDTDHCWIPIPQSGSYSVSGNNIDGFIVTVVVG